MSLLRDPLHVRQLRRASDQLLSALRREHPHIITHLTRPKET
jgi:hypothetical protein